MAEFSAAYLLVWAAFGLVALAAGGMMPGVPGPAPLAVVLAAAAAWQLSPFKRRCLRGCHRSLPLPPYGWRAEKGALRFGLRNGLYCLGTCWCQLLWTAGLTAVITGERRLPRPGSITRTVAALLGFATVAALAVDNLLQ